MSSRVCSNDLSSSRVTYQLCITLKKSLNDKGQRLGNLVWRGGKTGMNQRKADVDKMDAVKRIVQAVSLCQCALTLYDRTLS